MATSPATDTKSTAPAKAGGWVLEAKGKDVGSLNTSRDITPGANQTITVRPGTQYRMKPATPSKVDKQAETAETAKWGDDLVVTVPGGGQLLLKGFYNKNPNAPPSKLVVEQKNGSLRSVEGRPDAEPVDSPNPNNQADTDGAGTTGVLLAKKASSSPIASPSSSKGGGASQADGRGEGKDNPVYQEAGYKQGPDKVAKKTKKKSEDEDSEESGGIFAWFTNGGASSLGILGLLGLSGAKKSKAAGTTVINITNTTPSGDSTSTLPAVASLNISDDTGSSNSDFITQTATQTVSGTLSSALLAGQTVKVSANNGSTWTSATASTGSTSFTLSNVNLSGTNTLIAKVTTTSGVDGGAMFKAYGLDTVAPTATLTSATLANTASATVQSSETGTAYLVKTGG
ncbi:MAG: hypothetical protein EBQ68_02515, partial [Betaproteobacteria bacterium]|nr:hypothetical protein [Betaproteobacteria bacterium]